MTLLTQQNPLGDSDSNVPAVRKHMGLVKGFAPAMDMYETKDAIVVETVLAGVRPEDVEVSVENRVLTVQGSHSKEHEIEEKNYYQKEVRSGSFFRQVALPTSVKENEVVAEFADGVLQITAPKAEPGESKKVEVKIKK
jgi:HSP20 family protein